MYGKEADRHVLARMTREIEVSSDWFGCAFVISFHVSQVCAEAVA